ncbi:Meiotically up-regulated 14 protein [Cercospora beticola]|uniref:Meiotically up-regulated 14 protein n=1 Tax=Cercospora beticola TaxID=122368 RepID=A0A2G5I9D8_CERBT|nr:Meiotically up-regulated 14 protein [Cercospora beticola]PIB01380.1 Meiotically up-regulated 14 protein [Cercospora beticola]WPA97620.1 hypothetical protein RHO25_002230 [Cercospora beticola]
MSTTTTITEASFDAQVTVQTGLNYSKRQTEAQSRARIPQFEDKAEERKWQLEQMAAAFRIFAKLGFADGGSGHISVRDPVVTNTFWINPYAVHFGLLKVSDMVHVNEEGVRIGGADLPVNAAGFIIHAAIHKARPDINAACHVHSPYGRAWSNFGQPIDMLNQGSAGASSGLQKTIVGDEEAAYTKTGTGNPEVMYMQFVPEYQMMLKESGGNFLE